MYSRPHGDRIKIPENYSGHAFRDQSPYGDMPPPTHIPSSSPKREPRETPQSEPPRFPSPSAQENFEEPQIEDKISLSNPHVERQTPSDPPKSEVPSSPPSIFSSLLPSAMSGASHFPFGHGIGSEELLILAIMLLVSLSEEKDQELLLLLGFLLFAG